MHILFIFKLFNLSLMDCCGKTRSDYCINSAYMKANIENMSLPFDYKFDKAYDIAVFISTIFIIY